VLGSEKKRGLVTDHQNLGNPEQLNEYLLCLGKLFL